MCSRKLNAFTRGVRLVGGFTLLELMVVFIIMVILVAFAVPNFQVMYQRARMVSYTDELIAALQMARSEAIKRGDVVRLKGGLGSTEADLQTGWQMTANVFKASGADAVLQEHPPLTGARLDCAACTPALSPTPPPKVIGFDRSGGLVALDALGARLAKVEFVVLPVSCRTGTDVGRRISINSVGRISSKAQVCAN
jgi:type IV fimbrial biogenesis protein FimT